MKKISSGIYTANDYTIRKGNNGWELHRPSCEELSDDTIIEVRKTKNECVNALYYWLND